MIENKKSRTNDQHEIFVTLFSNVHDTKTDKQCRTRWGDLLEEFFQNHQVLPNKMQAPLINGWSFEGNDGNGKKAEYASAVSLLILDYDGESSIDEVLERFEGYEFVLATSYSHRFGDDPVDKFRVVFPLKKPVSKDEYCKRTEAVLSFAGGLDRSTTAVARVFFLPSCPPDTKLDSKIIHRPGVLLDLASLPCKKERQQPPVQKRSFKRLPAIRAGAVDLDRLKGQLLTLYFPPQTYDDFFKLAAAMRNVDFTEQDYADVVAVAKPSHLHEVSSKWADAGRYLDAGGNPGAGTLHHLISQYGRHPSNSFTRRDGGAI